MEELFSGVNLLQKISWFGCIHSFTMDPICYHLLLFVPLEFTCYLKHIRDLYYDKIILELHSRTEMRAVFLGSLSNDVGEYNKVDILIISLTLIDFFHSSRYKGDICSNILFHSVFLTAGTAWHGFSFSIPTIH